MRLDLRLNKADRAPMNVATRLRSSRFVVAALVSVWLCGARALADGPAPSLSDRDLALTEALKDIERPSRIWWGSWTAIMATLMSSQIVLAAVEDADSKDSRNHRAAYIAGASLSGAGLILVLATPMPGRTAYAKYKAAERADPEARVQEGEALLEASARAAERARSWLPHALALTLGLGAGFGLGLGCHDPWLGVQGGIGAALIVEARAWTYPQRARKRRDSYRNLVATREMTVAPLVDAHTLGVRLVLR